MKFRLIVKNEYEANTWNEDYDKSNIKTLEEAKAWAEETIKSFNATLRRHEKPRILVQVEILELEGDEHSWVKTSLATIIDRHGTYDKVQCIECLITGRRHGISTFIRRDREFKAPGYASCKQAKILLARREKRREKKGT